MQERSEHVAASVTPDEKRAIREAAAAADKSMSEFLRDAALDGLPAGAEAPPAADDGTVPPLQDFIQARLTVDEDADPVPKRQVYGKYVAFCKENYPEHEAESQHKVSREVAALDGVETGREYVPAVGTTDSPDRVRCFQNLAVADESEPFVEEFDEVA